MPYVYFQGTSSELWCRSDHPWEWCRWIHHDRYCDYEWISGSRGVEKTSCDFPAGKVELIGNYENNECGIRIKEVEFSDRGLWLCEIEKYYTGFSRRCVAYVYIFFPFNFFWLNALLSQSAAVEKKTFSLSQSSTN